jgi:3-oxoacyl-[acyl-carrier protein] reductase
MLTGFQSRCHIEDLAFEDRATHYMSLLEGYESMELGLSGRVALVTGASKGIGQAIALGLAKEGARLALVARNSDRLEEVARSIRDLGGEALTIPADLSTLGGTQETVASVHRHFGRIDILVNNAGAIRAGAFQDIPDEQWIEDWNLKLLGYIRMARTVFSIMIDQGGGRIVNVIGAAARNPHPNYLPGGTANAALVNFTKGLADLGGKSNILVTGVSPAAVHTERAEEQLRDFAAADGRPIEEIRQRRTKTYALGRIAVPDDVADLVCFLVSERASFLTGISITLDGGSTRGVYP